MKKRSASRQPSIMAPVPPASPLVLAPGPINAFFADLFISLNRHLALARTPAGKVLAVQEARQYLRGAEALWGYTKPLTAVPNGKGVEARSARQLLEHLFRDANAYIAEVEHQLAQGDAWAMPAASAGPEEEDGPRGTLP